MRGSRRLSIIVVLLVAACGTADNTTNTPSATPAGPTSTDAPIVDTPPTVSAELDPRITTTIDVPAQPRGLILADGRLWVASARADQLTGINVTTRRITVGIDAGPTPVSLALLDGTLWVSLVNRGRMGVDQGVARVDVDAGRLDPPIEAPVFHDVAAAGGVLWVLDGAQGLQRIDPNTGAVAGVDVGGGTQAITADASRVWGVREDGTLWRVDTAADTVTATADLDRAIGGRTRLALVDDTIWIGTEGAVVIRDAASLSPIDVLPFDTVRFVNDVEAAGDTVWVAATVRLPSRARSLAVALGFDRATHQLIDAITFGQEAGEIEVDGATMWAADQASNRIIEIELDGS